MLFAAGAISAPSQLSQATSALVDGDYAAAINRLAPLAETGDVVATRLLGGLYLTGKGTPKDCEKALPLLSRAASSGDARAQYLLGKVYGTGVCGKIDPKLALEWYKKAANQDDPDAAFSVGLYLSGEEGVPANLGEAYFWYTVSVQKFKLLIEADDIPKDSPGLRNLRAAQNNIEVLDSRMSAADKDHAGKLITNGSRAAFNLRCDGSEITTGKLVGRGLTPPPPTHFSRVFRIDPRVGFYCSDRCDLIVPLQRIDSTSVTFLDRPAGPPELGRSYERIDLQSGSYAKREKTALVEVDATGQCAREKFSGFPRK